METKDNVNEMKILNEKLNIIGRNQFVINQKLNWRIHHLLTTNDVADNMIADFIYTNMFGDI